jgi:hypothetical protein
MTHWHANPYHTLPLPIKPMAGRTVVPNLIAAARLGAPGREDRVASGSARAAVARREAGEAGGLPASSGRVTVRAPSGRSVDVSALPGRDRRVAAGDADDSVMSSAVDEQSEAGVALSPSASASDDERMLGQSQHGDESVSDASDGDASEHDTDDSASSDGMQHERSDVDDAVDAEFEELAQLRQHAERDDVSEAPIKVSGPAATRLEAVTAKQCGCQLSSVRLWSQCGCRA